ncbi:MAG: InlB B-repeat-containing protein [Lachnospiraceae bacterium]|nr:InlB B-repeat-containing protein [Lachnospiraceae bacterium]
MKHLKKSGKSFLALLLALILTLNTGIMALADTATATDAGEQTIMEEPSEESSETSYDAVLSTSDDGEEETAAYEEVTTVYEEETAVYEEDTTVYEEKATVYEEDTTVYEEATTVYEVETTVYEEETTVYGEETETAETETKTPVSIGIVSFPRSLYFTIEEVTFEGTVISVTYDDGSEETLMFSVSYVKDSYGNYFYGIIFDETYRYGWYTKLDPGTYEARFYYDDYDGDITASVEFEVAVLEETVLTELIPGETFTLDIENPCGALWFSYTPETSGFYVLTSSNNETEEGLIDPYIYSYSYTYVYDEELETDVYALDWDSYENDYDASKNFCLRQYMTAGETCYFIIGLNSEISGSFCVKFAESKVVSDFTLGTPAVTTYERGETLNLTGTTFEVTYTDGTTEEYALWEPDVAYRTMDTYGNRFYCYLKVDSTWYSNGDVLDIAAGTYDVSLGTNGSGGQITHTWTITVVEEDSGEEDSCEHSYGNDLVYFVWAEDYSSATVYLYCDICGELYGQMEAEITSEVITEATEEQDGKIAYTATADFGVVTVTDICYETIPALNGILSMAVTSLSTDIFLTGKVLNFAGTVITVTYDSGGTKDVTIGDDGYVYDSYGHYISCYLGDLDGNLYATTGDRLGDAGKYWLVIYSDASEESEFWEQYITVKDLEVTDITECWYLYPDSEGYQTLSIESYDEWIWFCYTPTSNGYYTIQSSGSEIDTYVELYQKNSDGSLSLVTYNDDGGSDTNFLLTIYLEKKNTYYYKVRAFAPANTGAFDIIYTAEYVKDITSVSVADLNRSEYVASEENFSMAGSVLSITYDDETTEEIIVDDEAFAADTYGNEIHLFAYSEADECYYAGILSIADEYTIAYQIYDYAGTWYDLALTDTVITVRAKNVSELDGLTAISVGETCTVTIENEGDGAWYSFIPAESGYYYLESFSENNDTYVQLFTADESGDLSQIEYNDDGGEGVNFLLSYYMTAGETYYYRVRMLWETATGSFEMTLTQEPYIVGISVEKLIQTEFTETLDYLDLSGTVVTVTYSDGTSEEVEVSGSYAYASSGDNIYYCMETADDAYYAYTLLDVEPGVYTIRFYAVVCIGEDTVLVDDASQAVTILDSGLLDPTESDVYIDSYASSVSEIHRMDGDFDVTYTFLNYGDTQLQGYNWCNYILEMYNGDGAYIAVRADNYGWLVNSNDGDDISFGDGAEDWDEWYSRMTAGTVVTLNIVRSGNYFTVTATAAGSTFVTEIYASAFDGCVTNVYLIGEYCSLRNINFTINSGTIYEEEVLTIQNVDVVSLSKSEFLLGQSLNLEGTVVLVTYSDRSTAEMTLDSYSTTYDSYDNFVSYYIEDTEYGNVYNPLDRLNNTGTYHLLLCTNCGECPEVYCDYYITVRGLTLSDIEDAGVTILSVDEIYTSDITSMDGWVWYAFTPEETGYYTLESTNNTLDVYAELWYVSEDGEVYQITSDDDSGDDYNFLLTYVLSEGMTYYYKTRAFGTTDTGSFDVTFTQAIVLNIVAVSFTSILQTEYILNVDSYDFRGSEAVILYEDGSEVAVTIESGSSISDEYGNTIYLYLSDESDDSYFNDYFWAEGEYTLAYRMYSKWTGIWQDYVLTDIVITVRNLNISDFALEAVTELEPGAAYTVEIENGGDAVWYSFTPTEAGIYIFEASALNDSFYDTYGELYSIDENGDLNKIDGNDDSGEYLNFLLRHYLVAGVTYYYKAGMLISDQTGSFTVTFKAATAIESICVESLSDTEFTRILDYLDLSGTVVTATYSDGSTEEVLTAGSFAIDSYGNYITYYIEEDGADYCGVNRVYAEEGEHQVLFYVYDSDTWIESNSLTVTIVDLGLQDPTESDVYISSGFSTSSEVHQLTGDFDVTYTFVNYGDTADQGYNWCNYILEMNNGNGSYIDVRADNYGWVYNCNEEDSINFGDGADDWETWLAEMKVGTVVTLNIVRSGNYFTVTAMAAGSVFTARIYASAFDGCDTYMSLTGECCSLRNITFMVNVTEKYCILTFDANGGTLIGEVEQVVLYNTTATEPDVPTRQEYVFCGWYDRTTGEAYDFSTPVTGDVSLFAKWTLKTFTVTFDANGGTLASDDAASQTVKYGATASEPVNPTRSYYVFVGWFTGTGSDAEAYDFSQTVTEDITLYAHWTTKTWTVSFDANYSGAEDIESLTVANGATAEEPTAIVRTGYSYIWCVVGTTTEYDFDTPVTGNLELYAKWTRTTHTVAFEANGGTLNDSASVTVKHNTAVSEPSNPTRTGYIFVDWYTEDGEAYDFDTLVTSNLLLIAKWQVKVYSVTFDANGGTLDADGESVTYVETSASFGTTIEQPDDPTRTGYTFLGWYITGTLDEYDFDTIVIGETDLYARWTRTVYTVTFDANGGTGAPDAQTVKYGATAAEPTSEPTREYYRFDGWYTADGEAFDFDAIITGDTTVYAGWTPLYDAVEIVTQPEDITAYDGETVYYTLEAEGAGVSYQWQYSTNSGTTWVSSVGTSASYKVDVYTRKNGYLYRCIVSDVYGNELTSDIVELAVVVFEITEQPQSVTADYGDTVTLFIEATGKSVGFLWQYSTDNGVTWFDSTNSSSDCEIEAEQSMNGYLYRCIVTDADGNTLVSEEAKLTVIVFEITEQPQDITAYDGDSVYFTISATGKDVSYQWQYSTNSGTTWVSSVGTSASYKVDVYTRKNGYLYRCIVSDVYGNELTSDIAEMTVAGFEITEQPENITAYDGDSIFFTISATGKDVTYQWQYSTDGGTTWVNSVGTSASYKVDVYTRKNGYLYRCIVSDVYGNELTSDIVELTVAVFEITEQPQDITAYDGDSVYFTISATGKDVSYQWQYSTNGGTTWVNSVGTSSSYKVDVYERKNGYLYRCIVTDADGNELVSDTAELVVGILSIVSQLQDVTAEEGDSVYFTIIATGKDVTYQWQYSTDGGTTWVNSVGTSTSYKVDVYERKNGYLYRCIVTDANGNSITSNVAELIVNSNTLKITTQPQDITAADGDTVYFTITATGKDVTYQWQYSTDGGTTWVNSVGTSASYKVDVYTRKNGYLYRCIVTDAEGNSLTSDTAELTVSD